MQKKQDMLISNMLSENEKRLVVIEKFVSDPDRRNMMQTDAFKNSGIKICSEQFFILMVDPQYSVDLGGRESILVYDGPDHLQSRTILRDVEFCFKDVFAGYPFIRHGMPYILLNLTAPIDVGNSKNIFRLQEKTKHLCEKCVEEVFKKRSIKIQIYLSPFSSSIDKIGFKMDTLQRMTGLDISFSQNRDVVTPPDAELSAGIGAQEAAKRAKTERALLNAALGHDFDKAYEVVCSLIDDEAEHYSTALSLGIRLGSRVEWLFGLLGIPHVNFREPFLRVYSCKEDILECQSVDELKDTMGQIFADFKEFFSPAAPPLNKRTDEIRDFIHENYADPNLCANMICERFNISISYLSRTFKEVQGMKLLDYIQILRVKKAKVLLDDTHMTIAQAAEAVGYQSSHSLTRAYKRYFADTPGNVRRGI